MRFNSINHHKSSELEKLASNLSAIEYIIGFRKRNKTIFNALVAVSIIAILVFLAFYMLLFANKAQGNQNVITASNSVYDDINQPTVVDVEKDIKHTRTPDNHFSSVINYSFDTDFLVGNGVNNGDICSIKISIVYRSNTGEARVTEEDIVPNVVVGNRLSLTTDIDDPDSYVFAEDIYGFNIK